LGEKKETFSETINENPQIKISDTVTNGDPTYNGIQKNLFDTVGEKSAPISPDVKAAVPNNSNPRPTAKIVRDTPITAPDIDESEPKESIGITKTMIRSLLIMLILIAVYNVVVFVIPFNRGGGFWGGYIFTMLAFILTAAVGFYTLDKQGLKSKFYGVPFMYLAWRYLAAQITSGFIQMSLNFIPVPSRYGIAINVILLGFFLIGLIGVDIGKEEIERIDKKVKQKAFYIKSLQGDVEMLAGRATSDSAKKALKELVDTIRFSDPMSSPQLVTIENRIEGKVYDLADLVEQADDVSVMGLCLELQQLFAERNRKCRALK
jgi:hypothetical protein